MKKTNSKNIFYKKIKPYIYILPISILMFAFYILPLLISLYYSFRSFNIVNKSSFIGINNYRNLFNDTILIDAFKNTIVFTIIVVPIQTFLSLIMAYWLNYRKQNSITKFVKGCMFVPVITSMVLIGIIWRILLNGDFSPINKLAKVFGIQNPNWLGNPKTALPCLMIINIWKNIGYFMVIYTSAMTNIPNSCFEAAKIDGASKWDEFWKIVVPLVKPTTAIIIFLGTMWSLQVFDLVYTMTGGGPGTSTMTVVVHIYNLMFKNFNVGYAMTVANVLLFIIASISIIQKKILGKNKYDFY